MSLAEKLMEMVSSDNESGDETKTEVRSDLNVAVSQLHQAFKDEDTSALEKALRVAVQIISSED